MTSSDVCNMAEPDRRNRAIERLPGRMDQAPQDHLQLHGGLRRPPCPRRRRCRCWLFLILVNRDDLGSLKLKAGHPRLKASTATAGSSAKGEEAR